MLIDGIVKILPRLTQPLLNQIGENISQKEAIEIVEKANLLAQEKSNNYNWGALLILKKYVIETEDDCTLVLKKTLDEDLFKGWANNYLSKSFIKTLVKKSTSLTTDDITKYLATSNKDFKDALLAHPASKKDETLTLLKELNKEEVVRDANYLKGAYGLTKLEDFSIKDIIDNGFSSFDTGRLFNLKNKKIINQRLDILLDIFKEQDDVQIIKSHYASTCLIEGLIESHKTLSTDKEINEKYIKLLKLFDIVYNPKAFSIYYSHSKNYLTLFRLYNWDNNSDWLETACKNFTKMRTYYPERAEIIRKIFQEDVIRKLLEDIEFKGALSIDAIYTEHDRNSDLMHAVELYVQKINDELEFSIRAPYSYNKEKGYRTFYSINVRIYPDGSYTIKETGE